MFARNVSRMNKVLLFVGLIELCDWRQARWNKSERWANRQTRLHCIMARVAWPSDEL